MLYDWTKPAETLEAIKGNILTSIKVEEDWYVSYRWWHSFFSRTIRVAVIILFSAGILLPIINYDTIEIETVSSEAGSSATGRRLNIGYIGLALGGLLLLLDKYLGVSSGYVRFFIAELEIKKSTHEFVSNWDIEIAKSSNPPTVENIVSLLNVIKQYHHAVFAIIHVETSAWATEFQTQTSELYELFKQKQNETPKPQNIKLTIENYQNYSGIEIGIDRESLFGLNGDTTFIFRNLSIGPHTVRIRAINSENVIVAFSKNVDALAEKDSEITLALP